ncbi:MAG: hypothetical protein U5L96_07645 [Owenweeksia sp.]|nr:hypothetical protein [Owenweeksia sp.]
MRNLKFGMIGIIGILAVSCEEEDLAGTVLEAQQALAEYYLDAEEALSNVYTIVDLSMQR